MLKEEWKIPPVVNMRDGTFTPSDKKIGWLREAIQDGEQFNKNQRAYVDMDRSLDIIAGVSAADSRQARSLSGVRVNRAKRNVREVVASLSNLRPLWGYKNDNKDFDEHAVVLNKLVNGWWLNTFADRRVRAALQYAAVMGGGYISPVWKRDFWNAGRGDIYLNVYGPRDVLFVQLPPDHDIQGAYAAIIRVRTPIHVAHAVWPEKADQLKPTYQASGTLRKGLGRVTGFVSPILRRLGGGTPRREEDDTPSPMVDIYHAYVMDGSINLGPNTLMMGDPDTNWSYEVPVFGTQIETSFKDQKTGQPYLRRVTREEAMLYPARRLFIACPDNNVELSDGPSPWWHRKVPLTRFSLDDWPWEANGYSMLRDQAPLQASRNTLMKAVDDSANARLRPNVFYDSDVLAKTLMDDLDLRRGGQNIPTKLSMTGEPIKPILPAQYYDQPTWIEAYMRSLDEQMDHMAGVRDMTALARARQIPSSESIDKIMEMAGPLVTDMSRNMESSLRDIGEMVKALFFQFYTTPRKVQLLGADGVTEEDYDYEPGSMIPSHIPGENRDGPSPTPLWKRARWHMDNFIFHVTPNSLHQITQMARKMLYLQLYRMGGTPFPMDPWTLADQLDMFIGSPPDGTKDMMERWAEWMGRVRDVMQAVAPPGAPGAGGAPGGGPAGLVPKKPGRPPSGNAPPHLVQKGGRQTIAESR